MDGVDNLVATAPDLVTFPRESIHAMRVLCLAVLRFSSRALRLREASPYAPMHTASIWRILRIVVACITAFVAAGVPSTPAHAWAYFDVNTTDDDVDVSPGDGRCATSSGACALRAAVQETNVLPGEDMIHVPAGTYILARQDVNDDGGDGDLDVTDTLRVIGDGPDLTIVDANHASRIFEVSGRRRVVLSNIRLRNGEASAGGALLAMAPIVLKRVVVETSHASTVGGGIVAAAGLRMLGSSVFDNAGWIAPGLAVSGGRARIRDSTFARNAVDDGGPSFGHGDVLAIGPGRVIIVNCTIAGEIGNLGYCDPPPVPSCVAPSDIVLANVTVDVVSFAQLALGGSYTVRNSIIGSCRTSLLSEGHLLIGDSRRCSVSGDMTGVTTDVDPMLDQLADNGGSTLTRMPLAGSPAIDAGSPAVPGTGGQSCAPRDQRGIARPIGRRCDLGAVEAGP